MAQDAHSSRGHQIAEGDVVVTGPNRHPRYHVLAIREEKAWLENVDNHSSHVVPVERCRKA